VGFETAQRTGGGSTRASCLLRCHSRCRERTDENQLTRGGIPNADRVPTPPHFHPPPPASRGDRWGGRGCGQGLAEADLLGAEVEAVVANEVLEHHLGSLLVGPPRPWQQLRDHRRVEQVRERPCGGGVSRAVTGAGHAGRQGQGIGAIRAVMSIRARTVGWILVTVNNAHSRGGNGQLVFVS